MRRSDRKQIVAIKNLEGIEEDKAYFLPRDFDNVQTVNDFEGERFWIAFHDAEWNKLKSPLHDLINNDCKIGEPQVFEAQGFQALLVEVIKGN